MIMISCGSKKDYSFTSAEVALVSSNGYETITLRSTGYGESKGESIKNAEISAFKNLFFRGIPSSNFSKPLIDIDETKATSKNQSYFDNFYNNRMKTFISSSYQSTPFQKKGGIYATTVDLKINVGILKRDLEENGVIRKFGL